MERKGCMIKKYITEEKDNDALNIYHNKMLC